MGFFNKLYLLNLIAQNKFFLFNTLFLIILIFGLYFYMQNLRFLHSTRLSTSTKPFIKNERFSIFLIYYLIFIIRYIIRKIENDKI
jgi:NADH:ubiquinone oxidoreductase subunit 2 (subunit N)